jgi:hypothetical protein
LEASKGGFTDCGVVVGGGCVVIGRRPPSWNKNLQSIHFSFIKNRYQYILSYCGTLHVRLRWTHTANMYLWFDLQLDALYSCLFTYNTFIK